VLGLVLFWVARPALMDDAYITLSYARNLAEHGQWALTTGLPNNTATSPLNVLLLAALTVVTGSAVVAAGVLLAVCLAVAAWVRTLAGPAAGVAATLLLAGAPVLNSAIGLEMYLVAALLGGVVRYAVRGPWWAAGICAGLLALARPDTAVMAVVVLAVCAPRRAVPALGVAAATGAPWVVWCWWSFGDLVPRTLAIKAAMFGDPIGLLGWVRYCWVWFPAASAVTTATLLAGLVAFGAATSDRDRAGVAVGAAGLVHLLVLVLVPTGGAFYYLAPAVAAWTLGVVLVAARRRGWWFVAVPLAVAGLLVAGGVPWADGFAPIRGNTATTAEYAAVAATLPPGVVYSTSSPDIGGIGEVGVLAFFAPPGTQMVEFLSDPGRGAVYVRQWQATHPHLGWLYDDDVPPPLPATHRVVLDSDPVAGPFPATAVDGQRSIRVEPGP
jgi:hypothetical protein